MRSVREREGRRQGPGNTLRSCFQILNDGGFRWRLTEFDLCMQRELLMSEFTLGSRAALIAAILSIWRYTE
ncbi:hypothetical protein V2J09_008365 [Rumex salicifolius]